jgi:hypothetical protein
MSRKEIEDRLDFIADSMPIARDMIEELADKDNIRYIDFFAEKTLNMEALVNGLRLGLDSVSEEKEQKIFEYLFDLLPLLEDYTDFITATVFHLQSNKK